MFLTLAHLDRARIHERFPTVAAMCRHVGLDLAIDPIPVGPAAHYLMGGVDTDEWGRTSVPGLFAAGETACTGRPRRQPPGQQLAARRAGIRGSRRGGDAAAATAWRPLKGDRVQSGPQAWNGPAAGPTLRQTAS